MTTERHILYADVVPYEVPSSLDALRGPADGVLTLPLHVWWGFQPTFQLGNREEVLTAYRAIVREGRAVDQEALLSRNLLIDVWAELRLPVRCRAIWHEAFPELRA